MTLDQLGENETAVVVSLTSAGANRQRMMDLGILPGTTIEVEMVSPMGDPIAYRVRGAVIALRKAQASQIHIEIGAQGHV